MRTVRCTCHVRVSTASKSPQQNLRNGDAQNFVQNPRSVATRFRICDNVPPMTQNTMSRRSFLVTTAAATGALQAQTRKRVPVGVLVYAVIEDWQKEDKP